MIKARRLFLVPAITAFLCILPLGFLLWFLIIVHWYWRNMEDVNAYFRGYENKEGEFAHPEELV